MVVTEERVSKLKDRALERSKVKNRTKQTWKMNNVLLDWIKWSNILIVRISEGEKTENWAEKIF